MHQRLQDPPRVLAALQGSGERRQRQRDESLPARGTCSSWEYGQERPQDCTHSEAFVSANPEPAQPGGQPSKRSTFCPGPFCLFLSLPLSALPLLFIPRPSTSHLPSSFLELLMKLWSPSSSFSQGVSRVSHCLSLLTRGGTETAGNPNLKMKT